MKDRIIRSVVTIAASVTMAMCPGCRNATDTKVFYIRVLGDLNSDGIVDIFDVVTLAKAFDSAPGDSNWNQAADLNNDDIVDIFDVVLLAKNFGKAT